MNAPSVTIKALLGKGRGMTALARHQLGLWYRQISIDWRFKPGTAKQKACLLSQFIRLKNN